jgi:hypothetical protein
MVLAAMELVGHEQYLSSLHYITNGSNLINQRLTIYKPNNLMVNLFYTFL